VSDLRVSDSSV